MYSIWSPPRAARTQSRDLMVRCAQCRAEVTKIQKGLRIVRSHQEATKYIDVACGCGHSQKIPVVEEKKL